MKHGIYRFKDAWNFQSRIPTWMKQGIQEWKNSEVFQNPEFGIPRHPPDMNSGYSNKETGPKEDIFKIKHINY